MEPRYQQILRALEARIGAGELAPGAKLPTEAELQAEYGVSRTTAAHALNELARAGLVIRRRRLGTVVADVAPQVDLMAFALPDRAAKGGIPGHHAVLTARVTQAVDAAVALPGAPDSLAVVDLVRLKSDLKRRPLSVERHVLPLSVAPDLLDQPLESLISMNYLRDRGIAIGTVRVYLDPVNLDQDDATLLRAEPGEAAMRRRREVRDTEGTVIEVVQTTIRPGSVQFFVELPHSTF